MNNLRPHLIGNPDTAKLLNDWPAYDRCLNACAEAERKLTDEQHQEFRRVLMLSVSSGHVYPTDRDCRAYVSALAPQRAAALAAVITAQKDTP